MCGVEGYIVKVGTAQAAERKWVRGSLAATATRDPGQGQMQGWA